MKKIGIMLLGIGFGILCYLFFLFFISEKKTVSPLESVDTNTVIQQNTK